jgi:hypothetical protein
LVLQARSTDRGFDIRNVCFNDDDLSFHANEPVGFFIFGFSFFVGAELLSYKIRLIPSFYISVALAVLAIALGFI